MNNLTSQQPAPSPEVAFVFNDVASYLELAAAFRPDVEVHVLDAAQDGLAQMASILAGRSGIAALHVIGHGAPGQVRLGSVTLDGEGIGASSAALGAIGAALAEDGDIRLYGCDVAADPFGARFVARLAEATGADVAASTGKTGSAARGGDWVLEYQHGEVGTHAAFDTLAVSALDSLLALPAAGLKDITSTMHTGAFVEGFTRSVSAGDSLVSSPGDATDPDGIYFYSDADQTTAQTEATLTVAADNVNLGSFDLTGLGLAKYSGTNLGAYNFTVTGYKPDGSTVVTTFHNPSGSTGFSTPPNFSAFTGIVSYSLQINSATLRMEYNPPQTGYPVSNWTIDSFTIANPRGPNVVTTFLGGSVLDAVQDGGATSVSSLLQVSDSDSYQTLTWAQQSAPGHGTLSFSGATATGGGASITPGGSITYTPAAGYIGTDSFTVRVYDGFQAVTKTISVTVAPARPSAPDLAGALDTGVSSTDNITKNPFLTFTGTGAAGDSSSTVRVFIDKNGNGSYDAGTDVTGTATMSNGAWTVSNLPASSLADGSYNVYAQTTSSAATGSVVGARSDALSVTLDTTAPTLSINSNRSALKAGETATVNFTFSEDPGSTFVPGDIAVSGGTLGALSGSGTTRTATFTPTPGANGSASITVASGAYTDAAGNSGGAGATPSLIFDTQPPTLAISSDKSALKAGDTATITFTFSEDPGASFVLGDVTVSGGSLGPLSGSGTTRTATFTPTAGTNSGVASITVAAGAYTDAATNAGGAGATPSLVFDTQAPSAPPVPAFAAGSDTGVSASDALTSDSTPTLTGSAEAGATITLYDSDGSTVIGSGTADGAGAWSITTSALAGGSHTVTAVARDAAGNASAASAALALTIDSSAPTLLITSDVGSLTAGETATITFTFSEDPGASFSAADIVVSGGTLSALSGSGTTRTATFTPDDGSAGAASITVAAGLYSDAAGNGGGAGATPALTFDTTAPTLSITSSAAVLRAAQTATITFTFSADPGASFTDEDITVTGGTLGAISGSGLARTATFTPAADVENGSASITVAAGAYADAGGAAGRAGASPAITFDTLAPTVPAVPDIVAASDTGGSSTDNITQDATPTITGTAQAGTTVRLYDGGTEIGSATADGSGAWSITPAALAEGAHSLSATATDAAGNTSAASPALAVTVDTAAPTLAITSDVAMLTAGQTATITFSFSEDPGASFTLGDISVTGGTLGELAGSGATRTAVFTPAAGTNSGAASITVASGAYADAAGNSGAAGATPALAFDTLAPTLAITSSAAALRAGETATITFTFSEDPGASFGLGDVTVSGGTLGALAGTGTVRTAVFTPAAGTNGGVAGISVASGAYTDASGNAGAAGDTPSLVFDTLAPAASSAPDLRAADDSGASDSDNITASTSHTYTGSAETGATVRLYDGATEIGSVVASDGTWTITAGPLAAGAHSITAVVTDAAGNVSAASDALAVTIDASAPSLSITSDVAALRAGATALITFTFSEDPGASFALGDIAVTGGTLGALAGSGATRTAVFTPAPDSNGGASISVASGAYADAAGNLGAAAATPALSFDTLLPTLAISSSASALRAGQTATVTFTFSEDPGSSFGSEDIAVSGGTLGALSGSGTTRTAVFTPDAGVDAGTASITVAAGAYADAAGNAGLAAATPVLVFDTLAPAAPGALALLAADDTGTSGADNVTSRSTPAFTGTAEDGATITLYDGVTVIGSTTAAGGVWSITSSALAAGSHTISATATDAAGNTSAAGSPLSVVVDTSAPSLAITSSSAALRAGETAVITFTFSEDPGATFAWDGSSGDIVVSGGTLGALSGTGTVRTAVFTPAASTNGGTAGITVAGGRYTDVAGNADGSGSAPAITFDTLAPTLAITSDTAALRIGQTATITFTFSEDPGASFGPADIVVSGGTLGALSGTGTSRTAVFTPLDGASGSASIAVASGAYADAAGNAGAAGATPVLVFDTLAPAAPSLALAGSSDTGASGSDLLTTDTTPTFTGSAEDGATVTLFDTDGVTVIATTVASGGSWSVTPAALPAGTHLITARATDAAGNAGAVSAPLALTIDTGAPTLAITSDAAALRADETATITFTFSEDPGATFGADDIAVSGGTLGALAGTGTVRTAVFTPAEGMNGGTASITVAQGAYRDAAGNDGAAGAAPALVFDTLAPTLAITSSAAALKAGETATITFTFSEDPGASFALGDIGVSGGTLGALAGSGTVRTATFTPAAGINGGSATVTVAGGAYTDAAGNAGGAGTAPALTIDTLAPAVAISSDRATLKAGESATITFTFSEDPGASFAWDGTAGDITVSGGTLSALAGTGVVRTAVFTPAAGVNAGTASIAITQGAYADAAGNGGSAGPTPSITFDTLAPTLAISTGSTALKIGETATITFTFSEDPGASFDAGDVSVSGGTLGALSGTGLVRTAVFTPQAGANGGVASVAVGSGAYLDAAGNNGAGAALPALVFDTLAPAAPAAPLLLAADDSGASASDHVTNRSTVTIHGTAEDGALVTLYEGAAVLGTATASGGTWSMTVAGLADGVHNLAATATDAAGNVSAASAAQALVVDTSAPALSITSSASALRAGETALITFTFSEDPGATFVWDGSAGDLVVSGGTLGPLAGTGNVRTAVFTPAALTGAGAAAISVASGMYADAAGNLGGAAAAPALAFDTLAPTLAITSDAAALKIGESATITFTFSEDPGASFTSADITVAGGVLGELSGTGLTRTAVFTPQAGVNGGAAAISVSPGAYQDAMGNGGAGAAGPSLVFDTLAPAAPGVPMLAAADDTGVSNSDGIINRTNPTFSGTAEDGALVTLYDGAAMIGTTTAAGGSWSFTVPGLAPGSHTISATATDAAGNVSVASPARTVVVDTTGPALAITSSAAALRAGETATITFTFSEDPGATFAWDGSAGDIVVNGGTLGALSGTGTVRTATFTPAAGVNGGAAGITVAGGAYTDAAGNAGAAASAPALAIDTLAPTLAITSSATALAAGQTALITFTFSEDPGASFGLEDVSLVGGTLGALSGSGLVRTATFTPHANMENGTAAISVSGGYADAAGNPGNGASSPVLPFDTLAPSAPSAPVLAAGSDTGAHAGDGLTRDATPTFTGAAQDGATVTLFDSDGVTVIGSGVATGGSWTITTSALAEGAHAITARATDAAGNTSGASEVGGVVIDTSGPSLTIASDAAALAQGQSALVTFTFSDDPGAGFGLDAIAVSGGTLGPLSGSGNLRTAVFTPASGFEGTASIGVAAGSYADAAGNGGAPALATLAIDTLAPAAPSVPRLAAGSDTGASGSDGVTAVQDLTFGGSAPDGTTVTLVDTATGMQLGSALVAGGAWSITVSGVAEGPLSVAAIATDAAGNASALSAAAVVAVDRSAPAPLSLSLASDSGAAADGVTNAGAVRVHGIEPGASWQYSRDGGASWLAGSGDAIAIAGDGAHSVMARQLDLAGNAGPASAALGFTLDTEGPVATVTLSDHVLAAGETATVTISFNEAVHGFDGSDITVGNGTLGALSSSDGGRTWTALLTPAADVRDDSNAIVVSNAGVTDAAGNAGAGSSASANYTVVTAGLHSTIELSDSELKAGESAIVTIRFNQPVSGFTPADLSVENGVLSGLATGDDGRTWTATLTPSSATADTTNTIVLANDGVLDADGMPGSGSSVSPNYAVSTVRPTATVSVSDRILATGETAQVTFQFSEAVTGFDLGDLSVTGGAVSGLASVDAGRTWTATLTAGANTGGKPSALGYVTLNLEGVQNAAGNAGFGNVLSTPYAVTASVSVPATVDGVETFTEQLTDPGTGLAASRVTILTTGADREDDPQTPHSGLADIPLGLPAAGGPGNSLTVGLPAGTGLQADGVTVPLGNAQAMLDLIGRIQERTAGGSAAQAEMSGAGNAFLGSLGSGATIESRTIELYAEVGGAPGQPIVVSGQAPGGTSAPALALVIDGSALPAGSALQLDNVGFAAIVGDLRVLGGAGRNHVVGDGGSQLIYLGAGDDVLAGGAGNDFIGSAGGDDLLDGGADDDLVVGGIGNDTVAGGSGDDILNGGRSATGSWEFFVSASGAVSARHGGAVFTASGAETVQGAELDAAVAELSFLGADAAQLVGVALLYGALGRAPDLAGLSFWTRAGVSLADVAAGVLHSAEWGGTPLGQAGDEAFVRGMYQDLLGREVDAGGLAFWTGALRDGAATRADVLLAVALSGEHREGALTADGYRVGQAALAKERGWFGASGDDRLTGGSGNDQLVGGDGVDTAVFAGNRADYRILVGADDIVRVSHTASGDVDTLSGIELAEFGDGSIDLSFLAAGQDRLDAVGMLYQAVFDRAGDAAGLTWWLGLGASTAQLAQYFSATAEFEARYGGMDDASFVQALYANSDLDAWAVGGMQAWQDFLVDHTRAELVAQWIAQDGVLAAQFGAGGLWLL